ncbi:MAG: hypothetical protein J7604_07645 [Sporocytophaga sp.]|uniref:hypothetical protein n=1 Tax=Sporocytophaga sp. TaxID=2231183 RepID=UPI001B16660A|nr:hypothetical protein [Sporocytophaga sp.]MBO9700069.1 hypothetical protein [Sporocytophaga sp.]
MKFLFNTIIFLTIGITAYTQNTDNLQDLRKKIAILKNVSDFEDKYSDEYYKSNKPFHFDYDSLKKAKTDALISILKNPRSSEPQIQKELKHLVGEPITSDDGKLKIYNFSEWITMATGRYYYNVIQYTTPTGETNAYLLKYKDCGFNSGFEAVYHLKGTDLYLVTARTIECSACYNEKAVVFKLTDKYLITDYPAFPNNKSCLSIDSRDDSLVQGPPYEESSVNIKYDKTRQQLDIYYNKYLPSDPSEPNKKNKIDDKAEDNPFYNYPANVDGTIHVILIFDGKKFVVKK